MGKSWLSFSCGVTARLVGWLLVSLRFRWVSCGCCWSFSAPCCLRRRPRTRLSWKTLLLIGRVGNITRGWREECSLFWTCSRTICKEDKSNGDWRIGRSSWCSWRGRSIGSGSRRVLSLGFWFFRWWGCRWEESLLLRKKLRLTRWTGWRLSLIFFCFLRREWLRSWWFLWQGCQFVCLRPWIVLSDDFLPLFVSLWGLWRAVFRWRQLYFISGEDIWFLLRRVRLFCIWVSFGDGVV